MKLCTFSVKDGPDHVGVKIDNNCVLDVTATFKSDRHYADLLSIIQNEDKTLTEIKKVVRQIDSDNPVYPTYHISDIDFKVPFIPPQIRCFSVYEQHLKNAFSQVLKNEFGFVSRLIMSLAGLTKIPKAFYGAPAYYKGTRMNMSGHADKICVPRAGVKLDYEAELGVVIGRPGKDIDRRNAFKHVFGYVIFNDFSERVQLMKEMRSRPSAGPAKGKDFDGSNCMGPWVVTKDEIVDPHSLEVEVYVNGESRGKGSTSLMTHRIDRIINYASWNETLHPGELLATGCVPNCAGIEKWRFLQDGDYVQVNIKGIGSLENTVVATI